MTWRTVLYSWFLTLLVGLVILGVIFELQTGFIFTLVAAVGSLPYLLFMLLLVKQFKLFLFFQLTHLGIASATAIVIYGMQEKYLSDLFWVVFCYFGVGLVVHAFFWFGKENTKTILE